MAAAALTVMFVLAGCGDGESESTQTPPVLAPPADGGESGSESGSADGTESPSESASGSGRESSSDAELSTDEIEWTEWELERRARPAPEPPPEMDDDGEAGAIAAAEYLFELVAYSDETRIAEALGEISTDDCRFCADRLRIAVEALNDGNYVESSEFAIAERFVAPPDGEGTWWIVRLVGTQDPRVLVDRSGVEIEDYDSIEFDFLVFLDHSDGQWAVREVTQNDATNDEAPS